MKSRFNAVSKTRVFFLPIVLILTVILTAGCAGYRDIYIWEFSSDTPALSGTIHTVTEADDEEFSLRYNFQKLDNNRRALYVKIKNAVFAFQSSIDADGYDYDTFKSVFTAFCADYPECFWLSGDWTAKGYKSLGRKKYTEFIPAYRYTESEAADIQKSIDSAADEVLTEVGSGASDYEKMFAVYNFITTYAEYDDVTADKLMSGRIDKKTDRSCAIDGYFIDRRAVCSGFSKATQLLLNRLGIECLYVTGETSGGSHSWNMVKLDGEYYYTDTTWATTKGYGDSSVDYEFFCITTDELSYDHVIDSNADLPYCDAVSLNYYVYNGLVAESSDEDELSELFNASLNAGGGTCASVKFSSRELYKKACRELFDDGDIFNILNKVGIVTAGESLSYCSDDGRLTVSVFLNSMK